MPIAPVLARVALTIAMAAVPWALGRVELPSLVPGVMPAGSATLALLGLSVVVIPLLVVELVAALAPPLRARRHGGPDARRPLRLAAIVLATGLGLWRAWALTDALALSGALEPGAWPRIATMLALGLGLAATLAAARAITRWGLGQGLAVMLVTAGVMGWIGGHAGHAAARATAEPGPYDAPGGLLGLFVPDGSAEAPLVALATVALTALVLHLRIGGARQPTAGLAPIGLASAVVGAVLLAVLIALPDLDVLSAALPVTVLYPLVAVLVAAASAWLCPSPRPRVRVRSAAIGAAFVLALYFLDARVQGFPMLRPLGWAEPELFALATGTGLLIDLAAEARARLALPRAVVAWTFQDVDRADRASQRLTRAGIPHHLAGWRLLRLLRITAPWAPARLLVPPERLADALPIARADEARPIVDAALTALG